VIKGVMIKRRKVCAFSECYVAHSTSCSRIKVTTTPHADYGKRKKLRKGQKIEEDCDDRNDLTTLPRRQQQQQRLAGSDQGIAGSRMYFCFINEIERRV
jgi:hypothetical protein